MTRKRYAICGVSNRARYMFFKPLLNTYSDRGEVVALLDKDASRMRWFNEEHKTSLPCYKPEQFDEMMKTNRPDTIIVVCQDGMHHHYIIEALKRDLDVIVEKPLTIDEEKCTALAKTQKASKGKVTMTFNYRYGPAATKIRELIAQGKVGKVISVDLNWYLDTCHGSSYFQRWNRLREVSGGLSIHKACHHFDLVRWWIGQNAMEVFAFGKLNFYGPKGINIPLNPNQVGDGRTCKTCDSRTKCRYYMRWNRDEFRNGNLTQLDEHVDRASQYEGYSPRQCIYDPQINIEDTYAAVVRYDDGAYLNYSLNASVPYEGFRLGINGTEGRIDYTEFHGGQERYPFPDPGQQPVIYTPMFGGRESIDIVNLGGGHGGGDPLLQDELFMGPDTTAVVKRMAGLEDGIEAVMTGISVHRSANEHTPISVADMRKRIWGA